MASREAPAASPSPTSVIAIGLTITAVYVSALFYLVATTTFDVWGALLLAPILLALSIPILRRQAVREADSSTFRLLVVALIVKLVAALARYSAGILFYGGGADASSYAKYGVKLSSNFRHFDFVTGLHSLTGTDFIRLATGVVFTAIGSSRIAGYVFFSWLGFWGLFLCYRAFVLAVPEGRRRSYARLLFFLPSLMFWSSSIGKEAWMTFAIGIGVFGVAKLLVRWSFGGLITLVVGLALAGIVRPHMAALIAVSFAAALVTRKSKAELRELAPVVKGAGILIVGVLALVLVVDASHFLSNAGIDVNKGVSQALSGVQDRTNAGGGSDFVPAVVDSPGRLPIATVTVLFRPLIFEAHNTQSLLAGIEGTFLLLLCLVRIRWIWSALRSVRRQPFVVFCLVYTILFIVAYSSFGNFGLLARERVQLYPLFLVLLTIPPASARRVGEVQALEQTAATG